MKFYVTTAIDYTNAVPHVGHSYQKIAADVLARWHRLIGEKVFFLTGTDEHGQKIAKAAKDSGVSEKEFVDSLSGEFKAAWDALGISYDRFIRTTDKDHELGVGEFVRRMHAQGDIYKGVYEGLYCEGCEAFVTEKDLVDGKCRFHPNREIKNLKEETYYFKLSKYQDALLKLYEENPEYISPGKRREEIINRVREGLKDLSITRTSVSWGIPFPLEGGHVIYVWYEALLNYLMGIGWPDEKYKEFWPADVELLGVDNSWFHCVIWPAMLLSVGIEPAKKIYVHGFLTFNGQKIGKSLGNAIEVKKLVENYGADTLRYYMLRANPFSDDGDFSEKALIERHNNELANKLGNLVARVAALAEKYGLEGGENVLLERLDVGKIKGHLNALEFDKALNELFAFIDLCNEFIQEKKPWESKDAKVLWILADSIKNVTILLSVFMPFACKKIADQFGFSLDWDSFKRPYSGAVKKGEILFKKIG